MRENEMTSCEVLVWTKLGPRRPLFTISDRRTETAIDIAATPPYVRRTQTTGGREGTGRRGSTLKEPFGPLQAPEPGNPCTIGPTPTASSNDHPNNRRPGGEPVRADFPQEPVAAVPPPMHPTKPDAQRPQGIGGSHHTLLPLPGWDPSARGFLRAASYAPKREGSRPGSIWKGKHRSRRSSAPGSGPGSVSVTR